MPPPASRKKSKAVLPIENLSVPLMATSNIVKNTTTPTPSLNNDSPAILSSNVLGMPASFNIPITAMGSVGEINAPNNRQYI